MNRRDKDLLRLLSAHTYTGQREMADACGCSLGAVNASVRTLLDEGYVDASMALTPKSRQLLASHSPRRAVLLAAGANPAPVFDRTPRALLTVDGEPLVERLIRQLQEVGITDICVVIGFQKERFEYLLDRYNVTLVVNPYYAQRHNLHSLAMVSHWLDNAYIIPADLWFRENPFRRQELYSWYMVADSMTADSTVRVNRKQELAVVPAHTEGHTMVGVSYLTAPETAAVCARLKDMAEDRRYDGSFWEAVLYDGDKFLIDARMIPAEQVIEADDREMLYFRRFSEKCTAQLAELMGVPSEAIARVTPLKNGVVNRTYGFECNGRHYVARFPRPEMQDGPDRHAEAAVYHALRGETAADQPVAMDPDSGLRIAPYIPHTRICDPRKEEDVRLCMQLLRRLHSTARSVPHTVDLFRELQRLEEQWQRKASVYTDYEQTKAQVLALRPYIESCPKDWTLTHIDPVPDNFLITEGAEPTAHLIDWEYAGMQDPHVDVAMFCLYALQDRQQVEQTIAAYFPEGCSDRVRLKIYCYMAVGGLLWSNWCEYEQQRGAEFGAYSLCQYRYAKEYSRLAHRELERIKEKQPCQK